MSARKNRVKKLFGSFIFALISLIAIVVINFFLPRLMPGDPVMTLLGAEDNIFTQEQYDYYYHALGLDLPMAAQFWNYFIGLFSGRLGFSYHLGGEVGTIMGQKILNTLQITIPAWVITSVLAYYLGTNLGYRRGKTFDVVTTGTSVVVNAIPTFLISILLIICFAYEWAILPLGSLNSIVVPDNPLLAIWDRIKHLILPVTALVIASTPSKILLMRNVTANALRDPYVLYARARGLSARKIRAHHIFPNVCQPFISMIGTGFGRMLAGSIVVELIFSIDGMGLLVNRAITDQDYPVLQAALFVIAVSVIISNLLSDLICFFVDPKQRCGGDCV